MQLSVIKLKAFIIRTPNTQLLRTKLYIYFHQVSMFISRQLNRSWSDEDKFTPFIFRINGLICTGTHNSSTVSFTDKQQHSYQKFNIWKR